ncbi:MAG: hypothetical protein KAJ48_00800, partial [Elusimicrobiales bacterium]|nr:hypothetical protein [Elusimicrobiales bacterium]
MIEKIFMRQTENKNYKNNNRLHFQSVLSMVLTFSFLLSLLAVNLFSQTTLYLHPESSVGAAPDAAQTTDTFGADMPQEGDNYRMDTTPGTVLDTSISYTFIRNLGEGYGASARFVSPPLQAKDLASTNWTIVTYGSGGDNRTLWYHRAVVYVWKNDNSGMRGSILLTPKSSSNNASAQIGAPTAMTIRSNEPASNSVQAQDGDRLVVEMEWHNTIWSTGGIALNLGLNDPSGHSRITCENDTLVFIPYLYNVNPSEVSVDQTIILEGALFGTPV